MIKINNITKKYNELTAVDNLSLEINKGEVIGLLGPNGAGKSTTMKLISGFLIPDSGDILVDNVSIIENPLEIKRRLGYMPENNPLYKELRVVDVLNNALKLHTIEKEKWVEYIDYAVKVTGLENVYYRNISELSKGYKQRVGIAISLIHKPDILILDEPTEGLDPNQRSEIRKLIKELGKDKTVIISTHVMQEVEAMCNRVVIINKGKLIYDDSITKLSKGNHKKTTITVIGESLTKKLTNYDFIVDKSDDILININKSQKFNINISTKKQKESILKINELIKDQKIIVEELNIKKYDLEEIFKELTN